LLVVDTLCPCGSKQLDIEAQEVPGGIGLYIPPGFLSGKALSFIGWRRHVGRKYYCFLIHIMELSGKYYKMAYLDTLQSIL
jgi:hypothetical protein